MPPRLDLALTGSPGAGGPSDQAHPWGPGIGTHLMQRQGLRVRRACGRAPARRFQA